MRTITLSYKTHLGLEVLAKALGLLDETGEPDVVALLDALTDGRILVRTTPDPPIGTPRWIPGN